MRCIDAFRTEGIVTRSGDADLLSHQQSYHRLIQSYKTQFLEWRDKAERRIEPYSQKDDTKLIFCNIRLYQRYATLILQSLALGRSTDLSDPDLPVVLTEVSLYVHQYVRTQLMTSRYSSKALPRVSSMASRSILNEQDIFTDVQTSSSPCSPMPPSRYSRCSNHGPPRSQPRTPPRIGKKS